MPRLVNSKISLTFAIADKSKEHYMSDRKHNLSEKCNGASRILLAAAALLLSQFAYAAEQIPADFVSIGIAEGLSHNIVNAIYKDKRGFVWTGTQSGLDRFDGITLVHYPQLKDCSVFDICETDSIFLWIGTDKGLICLNRKTEKAETVILDDKQPAVRTLFPLTGGELLIGTTQGLFILANGKTEKINFDSDALSSTNNLSKIVGGQQDRTFWITSANGLIYFDLDTRQSAVYKLPSAGNATNAFSTLACFRDNIYVGSGNRIVVFNTLNRKFEPFPYIGNAIIKTLSLSGDDNLYAGTNGGGLLKISIGTGEIIGAVKHGSDKSGISSNAVYAFLKDGNMFWIGTYQGGLNYTPRRENRFLVYSFGDLFDSGKYNVRSFWIGEDGRKIIGTRNDGLIYISEKEKIVKSFSTRTSILKSDIILSVYPLDDRYFLIGTFSGGLYRFDSSTATLSLFHEDECFNNGSFPCFLRDREGNLWIGSSNGIYVYNTETNRYTVYNGTNSGLRHSSVFSMMADRQNRIWIGTLGAVFYYDFTTGTFHSEIFPPHILPFTKSIRVIYEDRDKNIWFCDDKEGVVKVDRHFAVFEHFTEADFLPCNTISSIIEDKNGGMWIASQKGLICRRGEESTFYSLHDGIPGYIFSTLAGQTLDSAAIWWGNEQGLIYYSDDSETSSTGQSQLPVITSISISGEVLSAGHDLMPYSPAFTSEIGMASGNSIELAFSALNYAPVNTSVYEYCLEGYDEGWRMLMSGNKVSYVNLPGGKYIFKVRSSSAIDSVASIRVNVYREIPLMVWGTLICTAVLVLLLFSYSRLLSKYKEIKKRSTAGDGIAKEKYSKSRINDSEADKVRKKLKKYMQEEKPYLNQDLKQQDVAHAIGYTTVDVSQVLNMYLNTGFTDYVNQCRVEEFIIRVQDKSATKYTLASLSEQCGFSSRSSFFRSFKKIKGKTPAEFVRDMGVIMH
jgi:ligand-binding sensor domain-containing protein/AraC-like DNA-binding protein